MSNPLAVLISDIHYNINTLEVADRALYSAVARANKLAVPLIIAGDLHDTKALLRGECVKAIMETIKLCEQLVYVIPGNHCLINSRSKEHSLEFLRDICHIVDAPAYHIGFWMIPYFNDPNELKAVLEGIEPGSTVIMHQGVLGADMGSYVQDKTSLPPGVFADFRVISGHYHKAQDIECGPIKKGSVGLFSYIGNPYTLSFSEANDGPKGFRILMDDGSLTSMPLNLRKHVVLDRTLETLYAPLKEISQDDVIWLKVTGPKSELSALDKAKIGQKLFGHSNFKFDKIPTDEPELKLKSDSMTELEILDALIDNKADSKEHKDYLKALCREVME